MICPDCDDGRDFASNTALASHRRFKHPPEGTTPPAPFGRRAKVDNDGEPVVVPDAVIEPRHAVDEIDEPSPRKPKFMDRLKSRRGRGRSGGPSVAPATGERAPKRPKGRRVPLDGDISDIWAFAGRRLENTLHYPTGRMLQYQAPAAGVILDRAVAGTLPDRLFFQPIAKNRDKYEDTGFLIAGPLLTFSITTTMQRMQAAIDVGDKDEYDTLTQKLEVQREMFTWVTSMMLPRLAVGAKLAREKKEKEAAVIAEAFPDLGGDDPIAAFADMCFAPPPTWNEERFNGEADRGPVPPDREGAVPY
jgi:hypothetical protein